MRALDALVAVTFSIVLVAELWVAVRPDLQPVSSDDVARARAWVEAQRRGGEPVAHSPLFTPSALAGLGKLEATPGPPSLLRTTRAWILDRVGEPLLVPGALRTERERFGDVVVASVEGAAPDGEAPPLFDLYRDLGPGQMRVERRGRVVSVCDRARAGGGYACPGQAEWLYAARHEQVIDGKARACVWAHPITGASVVFDVPVPTGPFEGELKLTVGAGLSDAAVQTPDGAPVRTQVEQIGRPTRQLIVPNRRGWFEATYEVSEGAPIRLVVTTEHDGVRHHCLNATLRVAEDDRP